MSRGLIVGLVVLTLGTSAEASQNPASREKSGDAPSQSKDNSQTEQPATADAPSAGAANSEKPAPKLETATFAGGCFWCIEAVFERVPGVKSAVSGYSGGIVPNPTYQQVLTGQTGHAEAVQLTYDASVVSYQRLLKLFFMAHDPTTLNMQGPDVGTQYRSAIFYHNLDQMQAAERYIGQLKAAKAFPRPIVTELVPLQAFYPAEDYHQDYFRKHPNAPYCRIYIAPKLQKLKGK